MEPRASTPWLAYRRPQVEPRLRLFCFPYAGGGASTYRGWERELPAGVELCMVQLPGRETRMREEPLRRMSALVEASVEALRPFFDRPFCLFGHSMGALVAFELARRLRSRKWEEPQRLFVSGHVAPHLPYVSTLRFDLPEADFISALTRLAGTPEEVLRSPELLRIILRIVRADCEVCDTYQHSEESPFLFPISAYGGSEDEEVPLSALDAWQEHTRSAFEVKLFRGGHFYLHSESRSLLAQISNSLESMIAAL